MKFKEECCFLLSFEWNLCKVYPLYTLSSTLEVKVLVYSLISRWPCILISLESLFQFQRGNSFRPLLGKKLVASVEFELSGIKNHKVGFLFLKGRVNRWVGYVEWNNEECKMILFGPFNASLQEVRWCLPQGECFQVSEAICKDGNVGDLEEPLTGLSE